MTTPSQQFTAQLAAAAVGGWALGKLAVELARGGVATLRCRFGKGGGIRQ